MAKFVQIPYDNSISVPITTAQAVQLQAENPISLAALGLLVNLLSYPPTWELHKTQIYKRFAKSKEEAVRTAWKSLLEANYIIEFKYRSGKSWDYVYYFRKVPFTSEEKDGILDAARVEYGEIWGLDFPDLKMGTRKPNVNQKTLLNKKTLSKKDKEDDDKRTSSAEHDEEHVDLIVSHLQEETQDQLSGRSFNSVVRKVMSKYNQGKISKGKFRDYLVTALDNKINDLELRRQKETAKKAAKDSRENQPAREIHEPIPFYNWLDE